MGFPPLPRPPDPPYLAGLQPHERKAAERRFEEQMAEWRRQMERRKEQMEEREQNLKWMLAFMLVVAGLSVLVATGGALIGAYIEFGLRGPLVLIVSCLALFVAVAEVKTRI